MKKSVLKPFETRKIGRQFLGIYLVLVTISSLIFLSIHHLDQNRLARSYSRAAKDSVVAMDLRQAILSLNPALQDGFRAIAIRDHRGTLRAGLPQDSVVENELQFFDVRIEHPIVLGFDDQSSEKIATIEFYYSLMQPLLGVALFSILISVVIFFLFRRAVRKLETKHKEELKKQEADLISKMAMQVLHDIQSPLSMLMLHTSSLDAVPTQERQLLLGAVQRISDVAKDLLHKSSELKRRGVRAEMQNQMAPFSLSELLEGLVVEKRTEYRNFPQIQFESHVKGGVSYQGQISQSDLSRVISNLVNNSVKALPQAGKIKIGLQEYKESVAIQVVDNGKGMSEDFVAQLGKNPLVRAEGHGLGLSHAFEVVEAAGGVLQIVSQEGFGTIITIKLPK